MNGKLERFCKEHKTPPMQANGFDLYMKGKLEGAKEARSQAKDDEPQCCDIAFDAGVEFAEEKVRSRALAELKCDYCQKKMVGLLRCSQCTDLLLDNFREDTISAVLKKIDDRIANYQKEYKLIPYAETYYALSISALKRFKHELEAMSLRSLPSSDTSEAMK